jgi:two-component system CheB/CheR fusion protein
MNEELQSTNEELETINDELRQRTDALNESNAFLEAVLSGLGTAVIVVDHEMRVRAWNAEATELWGLREEEVQGAYLPNLDVGLPVTEVAGVVQAALSKGAEVGADLDAVNRRGRSLRCHVRAVPLVGAGGVVQGAIVQSEEVPAP